MKEYFYDGKPLKLSRYLGTVAPEISYSYLRQLLRTRDIKVNDKRISEDMTITRGDHIVVFADERKLFRFVPELVYESFAVMVFDKPRGISSEDYAAKLTEYYNSKLQLCHRLDTNTGGLLIFVKTEAQFEAMKRAFKNNRVTKKYIALLAGKLDGALDLKAYLVKDEKEGEVKIYDQKVENSVPIRTKVEPLEAYEDTTLAEIELITGKTHQIRAHMAHIGHPVVGDPKYGDYTVNRAYKAKYQYLTAYKLEFDFPKDSVFYYMNEVKLVTDKHFQL